MAKLWNNELTHTTLFQKHADVQNEQNSVIIQQIHKLKIIFKGNSEKIRYKE
jgi:hypothetical protein